MKNYLLQFIRLLFQTIIFWIAAFCIFIYIRYYAIGSEEGLIITVYHISDLLIFGVLTGVFIGILFAVVEFLFDKFFAKNLALALILVQKIAIYLIGIILTLNYVFSLADKELDINFATNEGWWKTSKIFWIIVSYFLICSTIFLFIKIANEKFGRGVFFNFLIGKYRKPREEKRIFMFLDLKGSTTIAEELGHYRYSEFIQDCFFDLNRIIATYDAKIYQYVGDEAVLIWKYKNGIKHNNCINLFFHFQNNINKKRKLYIKKYNLVPVFKAGLHGGKLIVTEVGTVKKEIAYHGDVINTSARIQGECNKYNQQFLCSNTLLEDIKLSTKYTTSFIGNLELKGKEEKCKISAITLN